MQFDVGEKALALQEKLSEFPSFTSIISRACTSSYYYTAVCRTQIVKEKVDYNKLCTISLDLKIYI